MDFTVAHLRFRVPAGANVAIPDRVSYAVKATGLRLTEGAAPDSEGAPVIRGVPIVRAEAPQIPGTQVGQIRTRDVADFIGADPDDVGGSDDAGDSIDADDLGAGAADDGESDASEGTSAVDQVATALAAQGVQLPGASKKERRAAAKRAKAGN